MSKLFFYLKKKSNRVCLGIKRIWGSGKINTIVQTYMYMFKVFNTTIRVLNTILIKKISRFGA